MKKASILHTFASSEQWKEERKKHALIIDVVVAFSSEIVARCAVGNYSFVGNAPVGNAKHLETAKVSHIGNGWKELPPWAIFNTRENKSRPIIRRASSLT